MIQIRNVPDALHRNLKVRAAAAGISLLDYLLAEIKEVADRPTLAELGEQLHQRTPVSIPIDTARLVRTSGMRGDRSRCLRNHRLAIANNVGKAHRA